MSLEEQRRYWDLAASTAHFALDFDLEFVGQHMSPAARVLDLGCGYGRNLAVLADAGYEHLCGVDPSGVMLTRAREQVPEADLQVLTQFPSSLPESSFDLILLIAVLTCVPDADRQRELIREIVRLLAPGGIVCVSDFLILENERNTPRYESGRSGSRPYGVFETDDRIWHRHHEPAWIDHLLAPFAELSRRDVEVETRHGNPARGFEYIGRR